MRRLTLTLGLIVFWALAAPAANDPATLKKLMEDTLAAVKAGQQDKVAALLKPLVLPDATTWFKNVFGDEVGAKLAAEYNRMSPSLVTDLAGIFAGRVKDGRTIVSVTKVESATDPNATGLQQQALAAMKTKVPLYTVRFVEKPGMPGYTLWSFVWVDGQFRLVGKMPIDAG
jgi:hypothetical protein